MGALYTVTMTKRHLVSKFDEKGNKIGDNETLVPITFRDLPLATANNYRISFPAANVKITCQAPEVDRRHMNARGTGDHPYPGKSGWKDRAPKPEPKHDTTVDAAMSGDMSAAVTAAVKGAS